MSKTHAKKRHSPEGMREKKEGEKIMSRRLKMGGEKGGARERKVGDANDRHAASQAQPGNVKKLGTFWGLLPPKREREREREGRRKAER